MATPAEVPLDREAIKLLASDTRLDILKALKKRRMTVSELASVLNLGKSTVFEHVTKLVEGGLVVRKDDPEREWVYYELSHRAQRLLSPDTAKIILLFSALAAALLLAGAGYVLYTSTTDELASGGVASTSPTLALAASDPRFLAGAESTVVVAFEGKAPPSFYLLTEDQRNAALYLESLPPTARALSSAAAGEGRYAVTLPAAPPGTYHLYVRDAEGRGNLRAMPALTSAAPTAAAAGGVFLLGVDDPTAVPLYYDGKPVGVGKVDLGAAPPPATTTGASPSTSPSADNAYAPGAAFDYLMDRDGGDAAVRYTAPALGQELLAEGRLSVEAPTVVAEPPFLYRAESQNLTLSVFHPDRGVVPNLPLRLSSTQGVLAEGRTDAAGRLTLPITPPGGGVSIEVMLGNLTLATVRVLGALTFEVGGDVAPGENVTLGFHDRATGTPVKDVKLVLAGSVRLSATDEFGEVTFRAPGAGTYPLRATREGYAPLERELVVGDAPSLPRLGPRFVGLHVEPGTEVLVARVDVVNQGNVTETVQPMLSVGEAEAASLRLTLEPGESRSVTLVAPAEPGYHNVSLAGTPLAANQVYVEELKTLAVTPADDRAGSSGAPTSAPVPAVPSPAPAKSREDVGAQAATPGPSALLAVAALSLLAALAARRRR